MKYSFYIIAVILLFIGAFIFWGFRPFGTVHVLLLGAGFFIVLGFLYNNYKSKQKFPIK
jgi:hypothetical protein